jgi:hypothetical protein
MGAESLRDERKTAASHCKSRRIETRYFCAKIW